MYICIYGIIFYPFIVVLCHNSLIVNKKIAPKKECLVLLKTLLYNVKSRGHIYKSHSSSKHAVHPLCYIAADSTDLMCCFSLPCFNRILDENG